MELSVNQILNLLVLIAAIVQSFGLATSETDITAPS